MSQGVDGVGSNSQDGESELMDADGCAMIGETLQEQIERHVIRFTCGDFEPLAGIVINPPAETEDIDREIKIDQHLGEFGVKLSKKDMLERYGRTEAASEDDAATRKVGGDVPVATFGGFANEAKDLPAHAGQIKAADQRQQGQDSGKSSEDVLKAFSKDTGPAADAIKELLKNPSKESAAAILGKLDTLLPEDPEMAAVLADAMVAKFGDGRDLSPSAKLQNEVQRVPSGNVNGGQFTGATNQPDGKASKNESASDDVKTFLLELPKRIDPERADKILSEGFFDTDADGNDVHYGHLLLDHINLDSHSEEDKNARKKRLGEAISMVRQSCPMKSGTPGKDKERVYFGLVEGKAYIAVADEHDEINAMEMVSYRRDGRKDER